MAVSELVKEAWQVNDGMNKVLLEHLTPDMLTVQTLDKNWTVAGYLAHMAGSKKWWGTHVNNEEVNRLPNLYSKSGEKFIVEKDLEKIKAVFEQTSKMLLETADRAEHKGALPYASIDLYLIHMMMHDTHHRGQILLALRTAGYEPPDENTFWGGWWPEQTPEVSRF
jgi:uncharacterized damage-inducible protein DinB